MKIEKLESKKYYMPIYIIGFALLYISILNAGGMIGESESVSGIFYFGVFVIFYGIGNTLAISKFYGDSSVFREPIIYVVLIFLIIIISTHFAIIDNNSISSISFLSSLSSISGGLISGAAWTISRADANREDD